MSGVESCAGLFRRQQQQNKDELERTDVRGRGKGKKGKVSAQVSAHNIRDSKLHCPFLKEKGGTALLTRPGMYVDKHRALQPPRFTDKETGDPITCPWQ